MASSLWSIISLVCSRSHIFFSLHLVIDAGCRFSFDLKRVGENRYLGKDLDSAALIYHEGEVTSLTLTPCVGVNILHTEA